MSNYIRKETQKELETMKKRLEVLKFYNPLAEDNIQSIIDAVENTIGLQTYDVVENEIYHNGEKLPNLKSLV